jgi:hypothetical protein
MTFSLQEITSNVPYYRDEEIAKLTWLEQFKTVVNRPKKIRPILFKVQGGYGIPPGPVSRSLGSHAWHWSKVGFLSPGLGFGHLL